MEEKCDRRIELLTQSIKKNRKRTRVERPEEDDEEWVPKMFLHTEQNKVKVSGVETSVVIVYSLGNCFGLSRKASWTSAAIFAGSFHWCAQLQFCLRSIDKISKLRFIARAMNLLTFSILGPVSQKSPNFLGLFRVPQFPLYLRNAGVLSYQTSQSSWFFLH